MKEFRHYLNLYKKLITVRSQHNKINLDGTQIGRISDLMTQVDVRVSKIESDIQNIKGIFEVCQQTIFCIKI